MKEFLKGVREELKQVIWPTREEVIKSTWIILITVIIISLFLYFVDFIFEKVFDFLVGLGSN